jgi:hypothetical protein
MFTTLKLNRKKMHFLPLGLATNPTRSFLLTALKIPIGQQYSLKQMHNQPTPNFTILSPKPITNAFLSNESKLDIPTN